MEKNYEYEVWPGTHIVTLMWPILINLCCCWRMCFTMRQILDQVPGLIKLNSAFPSGGESLLKIARIPGRICSVVIMIWRHWRWQRWLWSLSSWLWCLGPQWLVGCEWNLWALLSDTQRPPFLLSPLAFLGDGDVDVGLLRRCWGTSPSGGWWGRPSPTKS